MTLRRVRPIASAELEALSTKRLLAYRSKLLGLEESAALSDRGVGEVAALDPSFVYFKDQVEWQELYASVKRILADREHVER
jgi:hypothetical protein